ncbi:MAG: hypothetical protein AB2768_02285 [Candidatus Thiodiazotropha endolucinida]
MDDRDVYTQAFDKFTAILKNTEYGKQALAKIKNDPRAKNLEGYLINTGRGLYGYGHRELALWYLWASDRLGKSEADKGLHYFLDSEIYPVLNTVWIVGIEVEKAIELESGLKIVPIEDMPESLEKEAYSKIDRYSHGHPVSGQKPKAAIVHECNVQRNFDLSEDMQAIGDSNINYWESSRLIEDTSLILNTISGASCISYFSTSYSLSNMPFGFFLGGAGSPNHNDAIGFGSTKLDQKSADDINQILNSFIRLEEQDKAHFRSSLSRLSQSKRKHMQKIEDKILDLCIALEMVLLIDNKRPYSKYFRERGSMLIGVDDMDRLEKEQDLKDIYHYRSQVAHTGVLCEGNIEELNRVHENFDKYCNIADNIIHKLITKGA